MTKNLSVRNSRHRYHHDPGFIIPNSTSFCCNVCSLQFGDVEELVKHCMKHIDYSGQECLICSEKFQEKCDLRSHFISHDLQEILGLCINVKKIVPRKPPNSYLEKLFCKLCGYVAETVLTFTQHLTTHVPKLCYLCHLCDQTFVSSVYLEDHFKTHSREEVYTIAYHTQHLQTNQVSIHNLLLEDMKNNPDEIDLLNSFYCHFCCSQIHQRKDIHIEKYHAKFYTNIAHKCYICGGFFDSMELLREHIRKYTSSRPWPVVNKEIDDTMSSLNQEPELIKVSGPNSWKNRLLSNDICKKGQKKSKMKLLKSVSKPKANMSCEFCGKLFSRNFSLKYHIKLYHSCSCGKCFKCKKAHKQLLLQDLTKSIEEVQCSICNKNFPNKTQLLNHNSSEHPYNRKPFKCKDCEETFGAVNTLKDHQRTKHTFKNCTCVEENDVCQACIIAGEKNYKCSYCNKGYDRKNSLKAHEKIHLGITKKQDVVCHVCGKKYHSHQSLNEHLLIHKIPCRCGNCEICQKIDSKHQCDKCKKIFLSNHKLKRHALVHSGERPFVCEICGKGFNQNGNLLVHLKSHKRREKKP